MMQQFIGSSGIVDAKIPSDTSTAAAPTANIEYITHSRLSQYRLHEPLLEGPLLLYFPLIYSLLRISSKFMQHHVLPGRARTKNNSVRTLNTPRCVIVSSRLGLRGWDVDGDGAGISMESWVWFPKSVSCGRNLCSIVHVENPRIC